MSYGRGKSRMDREFRVWMLTHLAGLEGQASPEEVAAMAMLARLSDESGTNVRVSPNGRFAVSARDGMGSPDGGWDPGWVVAGDMVLGRLCFEARFERPRGASVSDEGLVLVEDWRRERPSGALHLLDAGGNVRWRRNFDANILGSGLSADGSRAFVCTGAVPGTPPGFGRDPQLHLLDGTTGEALWTRGSPEPYRLRFHESRLVLTLGDEELGFDERGCLLRQAGE